MATLTENLGQFGDARMKLRELAQKYPRNADIEGALGYVEELREDRDAALEHYRAALALPSGGWLLYWNYARLLDETGGELDLRVKAYDDLLQRRPGMTEARLRVAQALNAAGRFSDALARLQQAPAGETEQAALLYVEMSVAAFGMRQDEDARKYAEQAKAAARTREEKVAVDWLFDRIEHPTATPATQTGTAPPPDPDRPILRRKSPPPPPPDPPAPPPPAKKGGHQGP